MSRPAKRAIHQIQAAELCARSADHEALALPYPGLAGYRHDPRIVGKMAGHIVLPWIHRAFSLMKRWSLGTYHGLRRKHVDTYLNEFVFRYNRRFHRHVSFEAPRSLRRAPAGACGGALYEALLDIIAIYSFLRRALAGACGGACGGAEWWCRVLVLRKRYRGQQSAGTVSFVGSLLERFRNFHPASGVDPTIGPRDYSLLRAGFQT